MPKFQIIRSLSICLFWLLLSLSQPGIFTTFSQNTESKTVYKYGFINKTGKYVVPSQFDWIGDFSEGLALIKREGKSGYIDKKGKIVIPLKFEGFTSNFSEGLAQAALKPSYKLGYIDKTGNYVIPPQFDEGEDFREGLALVKVKDKNGYDRYGYINKLGKYAVQPKFDYATGFNQGLAIVRVTNDKTFISKYGLIDKTGKYIIKPSFDYINDPDIQYTFPSFPEFKEGLMRVGIADDYCLKKGYILQEVKRKVGFIDRTGKIVIPLKFDRISDFSNGRAVTLFPPETARDNCEYWRGGKYGYINKKGEVVIPAQFNKASDFSEGLALVKSRDNELYGYINKTGKFVIPPRFSFALGFKNGLAIVEINGKRGMIDKTGKYIIEPKFESVTTFSEGLAIVGVRENGELKYGYVDQTGKIVIEPQFDDASDFSEGLAAVTIGGKSGYIDVSGNFVIPFGGSKFSEGLAAAQARDSKLVGYINKTGEFVISPRFYSGYEFENGLADVMEMNGKRGLIDKNGKYVIEPKFETHTTFYEGLAIVGVGENGELKYGYVDQTGKIVIEPQFDRAGFFEQGLAVVGVKTEVKVQKDCENAQCNSQGKPSEPSPHKSCKLLNFM